MAKEHFEALRHLRDHLVEERRQLVLTGFSDAETRRDAAGEFIGLQHFIDAVEHAMQHEASLERPDKDRMRPPQYRPPS